MSLKHINRYQVTHISTDIKRYQQISTVCWICAFAQVKRCHPYQLPPPGAQVDHPVLAGSKVDLLWQASYHWYPLVN